MLVKVRKLFNICSVRRGQPVVGCPCPDGPHQGERERYVLRFSLKNGKPIKDCYSPDLSLVLHTSNMTDRQIDR